jgi:hypothetical protein
MADGGLRYLGLVLVLETRRLERRVFPASAGMATATADPIRLRSGKLFGNDNKKSNGFGWLMVYIPPFAMGLRRMAHPFCCGWRKQDKDRDGFFGDDNKRSQDDRSFSLGSGVELEGSPVQRLSEDTVGVDHGELRGPERGVRLISFGKFGVEMIHQQRG